MLGKKGEEITYRAVIVIIIMLVVAYLIFRIAKGVLQAGLT